MRTATILSLVALAVVVAGCGGGKSDPRTAYAKSLDALCTQLRTRIEALGEDAASQAAGMPKRYRIGIDFVHRLRALHPSAKERAAARKLVATYAWYWGSQQDAYLMFQSGNYNNYENYQNYFSRYQKQAEAMAARLGAKECSRQPFSK